MSEATEHHNHDIPVTFYYCDEKLGWRWKCRVRLGDGFAEHQSTRSWRTRRGAIDDWNEVNRVIDRLREAPPDSVV